MSSFFSLLIKLLRTKSLQSLRRSENCKLISRNWDKLHIRSCHSCHIFKYCLKLPWNSFFPWILLKSKDRTCDYDTPKVKYYELYHFSTNFCFSCKGQGNYIITWCTWRGWMKMISGCSQLYLSKTFFDWVKRNSESASLLYTAQKISENGGWTSWWLRCDRAGNGYAMWL